MDDQSFEADADSLDIAIIGMAGRFPKARDLDEYWRNLREGRCSVTSFTAQELIGRGVDPALVADPRYVRAANLLEDSESFDADFFGYSPREAELMDPQHRVLLECAWAALENAGQDPGRYDGLVGVYAGAGGNTYLMVNVAGNRDVVAAVGAGQVMIGNSADFLATRVAYKLGLEGPAINVQSACSTSLVAVVLACQGLLAYQCDTALAGGVAVDVLKSNGYLYSEDGIYSPDGYCRSFDAEAKGTIGGNGVGMVVLKRLPDAMADGDHIHAVIKGSAVNNDGSRRAGFTAPGVDSQALVIATALANAGVDPATVGYVEAHGTATKLGDPIEFAALKAAFQSDSGAAGTDAHCALGSVKTNIGHLDAAAGIAGLIKAVLAVEHGQIPPTLHFQRPNPRIELTGSPFFVNTGLIAWPVADGPRRAGVSSFGLGGTNAHVVLEQSPHRPAPAGQAGEQLIVLSAKSSQALDAVTDRLGGYLGEHPGVAPADIAFTLQTGRKAFRHRRVVVGSDCDDIRGAIEARDDGRLLTAECAEGRQRPVAFMFPGFGEQFPNMARQLYEQQPAFTAAFDRCAAIITEHLGHDIRDVIFEDSAPSQARRPDLRQMLADGEPDSTLLDHPLNQPVVGYPAVFAVEYALVELWRSLGVVPEVLIGHSLGEYVAACVAGVFSLQDALHLVFARARLISEQGAGAMIAVPLTEQAVAGLLDDEVALAAVNDPRTCVLSGTVAGIERVARRLQDRGIVSRRLTTRYAFHSPMMDAVVEPYQYVVSRVTLRPPAIRFVSNVTGTWITPRQATDPAYWARHLRAPVRFADGMSAVWEVEDVVLLEAGPGRALASAALQHPVNGVAADRVVVGSLPDGFSGQSDRSALLNAVGRLWLAGVQPRWEALHSPGARRRVPLPSYPFERRRYWLEPGAPVGRTEPRPARADPADWFYDTSWQRLGAVRPDPDIDLAAQRWLVFVDEHGVGRELAARLAAMNAPVSTVAVGTGWARPGPAQFVLDPNEPGHYAALAQALRDRGVFPDRVVHCWAMDDPGRTEDLLARGFRSLVGWARAAEPELMAGAQRWDVVSTRVHDVLGDEPLSAVKATIQGVCKVAPQEYPSLRCAQFDVGLASPDEVTGVADRLMTELTGAAGSSVVALRGPYRWQQTFLPTSLATRAESPVRPGGVYLITGGLGKIGLVLARSLAQSAKVRLVLLGRNGLPPRDSWDDPTHPAATAEAIAAVNELSSLGAEVMVCAADVAVEASLRAAVAHAVEAFGPINGVIHAAGSTGPSAHRVLAGLSTEECDWHFGPKLHGVYALEAVLADQDLDFAILCSSVASLLGGLGFAAYAAANAFLDAVARHRGTSPIRWTSVNWEAWRFGAGEQEAAIGAAIQHGAVDPAEGQAIFERLLAAGRPSQVIVSTTDLAARSRQWINPAPAPAPQMSRHARPNLRNPYVEPGDDIERALASVWQDLLGLDRIGVHDNFFELGGSSLLGLQVVHRLRTELRLSVPLTVVYEGPTIHTLARLIGELA